jgi:hypothetical protein
MYRKVNQPEITPNKFKFSNQFKLSAKNRWVIMVEKIYADFDYPSEIEQFVR